MAVVSFGLGFALGDTILTLRALPCLSKKAKNILRYRAEEKKWNRWATSWNQAEDKKKIIFRSDTLRYAQA